MAESILQSDSAGSMPGGTMDDSSGQEGAGLTGNQGAQPPTPGGVSQGSAGGPAIKETDTDRSDAGDVLTKGLAGTNTSGGTPPDDTGVGLGSDNH